MNAQQLAELLKIVPIEADEIVVKGREHDEVFFSMPKGWKPPSELEARIRRAPSQPAYPSHKTMWRWRAM